MKMFFLTAALFLCIPAFTWAQAPNTITPSFQGRGNSFNPEIGINGLFLYTQGTEGNLASSTEPNGLGLQELEMQFSANVDPYSRFVALLSLHAETTVDETTLDRETEYVFEPEEVYAESISVPMLILKAGKFKSAFGKHGSLHTHAFPFIDAPLYQSRLLGDEGLNDIGVSASALLPAPWYSEVTAQFLRGDSEGLDYFNSRSSNDVVSLAKFKNLWDLNDSATIEWGLSGATGHNRDEGRTDLIGTDLTFKWRPVEGGRETSLSWTTEFVARDKGERNGAKNESNGVSTWLQYQFSRRGWVQARGEWLRSKDSDNVTVASTIPAHTNKWSALVGFIASEYSAFRIQYDQMKVSGASELEHRALAQLNFSIGAHPAHQY